MISCKIKYFTSIIRDFIRIFIPLHFRNTDQIIVADLVHGRCLRWFSGNNAGQHMVWVHCLASPDSIILEKLIPQQLRNFYCKKNVHEDHAITTGSLWGLTVVLCTQQQQTNKYTWLWLSTAEDTLLFCPKSFKNVRIVKYCAHIWIKMEILSKWGYREQTRFCVV